MPIDAKVIPHLKRTRIVVRNGVGFDVVDLKACGEAGIVVCNVPDYGTTEVADTAIAMMLTFARGTAALDGALRAELKGGWTHVHNVTARRLRGAAYGVIGLGRIGTASALRARAFGMNVAFYDPESAQRRRARVRLHARAHAERPAGDGRRDQHPRAAERLRRAA